MDKTGFRSRLLSLKVTDEAVIADSIAIAERFDAFIHEPGRTSSPETAWDFSKMLIAEGANTYANYLAVARYCRFIHDDTLFVAVLEVLDGGEVGDNLYTRMADYFGAELRDEVFAGSAVPPFGVPAPEKPGFMHPIIHRLEARVGRQACSDFLSASLRDLPDAYYQPEVDAFKQSKDIDDYLVKRKEVFVAQLEACMNEGRLFFSQEITPQVLDFVRADPEIGGGVRRGNIVYETKIPYQTKQYLEASDPVMKRYYACHCPWAREAIRRGGVKFADVFCQCSGGYHKRPFELNLGQPVKVETLASALKGDPICRFAIILPESAIQTED